MYDILYVYSENAHDTNEQQREDRSVLDHDHCTVYEIKPLIASTNQIRILTLELQLISVQYFFEV
jgi:hypothetical protein